MPIVPPINATTTATLNLDGRCAPHVGWFTARILPDPALVVVHVLEFRPRTRVSDRFPSGDVVVPSRPSLGRRVLHGPSISCSTAWLC
jgi:hypothetical protein